MTRKTESELSRCHMVVAAPQDTGSEELDSGTWEGGSWYLSVGLLSWPVPTCSGLSPFFSADGVQRLWRGRDITGQLGRSLGFTLYTQCHVLSLSSHSVARLCCGVP